MELQAAALKSPLNDLDAERILVDRARQDRRAFAELYRSHYPTIFRYVLRRVGDRHVTEDLVTEVFMTAMRALPRYRWRGIPIRAWFYRLASNTVNRWVRQQRRTHAVVLPDGIVDPRPAADASESRQVQARRALLALPPKYQTVLALHYIEGLPIDVVARTIGCRPGTVKSRLSRGRDALRHQLGKRRS